MIELARQLIAGDRRALARLLSYVENEREGVDQALAVLFPHTGRAHIIGVTGAPGTGKSSLVNALAKAYRARGQTVGILAVDPTSPFTGGAILGDRIRMRDLAGDSGVFIRSMATRGSLGGLALAARDAVRLLDAAGFDRVLVETVGAGQNEVEVARAAHTTLVVEAPGLGDDVQAIKAGILEIADVLVVNKADRPGAANTVRALKGMLELGHPAARRQMLAHHGRLLPAAMPANGDADPALWIPPLVQTVATEDQGVDALLAAVDDHRAYLTGAALARREREQIAVELTNRLRDALLAQALAALPGAALAEIVGQVQARAVDPQSAVRELLAALADH